MSGPVQTMAGPAPADDAPGRGVALPAALAGRMACGEASGDDVQVAMAALAVDLVREMGDIRRPLDAELLVSYALGGGLASAIEGDRDWDQADELQMEAVGPLADQLGAAGTEPALALLRVMAVLGGRQLRGRAGAHARWLAGRGVADRPWAGRCCCGSGGSATSEAGWSRR